VYRATTPTHTFIFDIDPDESFEQILITYVQNDNVILEKDKSDLTFSSDTSHECETQYLASLKLTQEESNLFSANPRSTVTIQLRALTPSGDAVASEKMYLSVQDVLNDEVLENDS